MYASPMQRFTHLFARLAVVAAVFCATLVGAAAAHAQSVTVQLGQNATLGTILTDGTGKTLYRFTKDSANTSVCYDACAQNWPPLLTTGTPTAGTGVSGKLGTTARTDGMQQVTYDGMPLYFFAGDKSAGDTNGQNVGTVWFVINATAAAPVAAPAAPAAAPAPAAPAAAPTAPAQLPKTSGETTNLAPFALAGILALSLGGMLAYRARRQAK